MDGSKESVRPAGSEKPGFEEMLHTRSLFEDYLLQRKTGFSRSEIQEGLSLPLFANLKSVSVEEFARMTVVSVAFDASFLFDRGMLADEVSQFFLEMGMVGVVVSENHDAMLTFEVPSLSGDVDGITGGVGTGIAEIIDRGGLNAENN